MKPLICADCRWFIEDTNNRQFHKCKATEVINLVTGKPTYQYCEPMRHPGGVCGMEGKLFELNIPDPENNHGE